MVINIHARSKGQLARQRHAAMKYGLPFEPTSNPLVSEVTYTVPTQVLAIIREAGGTLARGRYHREMTRKEML